MFLLCVVFVFINLDSFRCVPLGDPTSYETGGADLAHLGDQVFGKPSLATGKKLQGWSDKSGMNPEELGEYAEGDILFPAKLSKNGLIAETARWPNAEVPYEISGHFPAKDREMIKNAMEQYHRHSCVRFRRREASDSDWIDITSGNSGCWSSVGRTGGRQELNLQSPGCLGKIGTPMHELLHALGFQHEQNRWERDSYVAIHWGNIQKGRENNFKKSGKDSVSGFGVPYDYRSVMHYSEKAFSQNGDTTIAVLKDSDVQIGQREGFSEGDLEKLLLMYNCPAGQNRPAFNISSSGPSNEHKENQGGLLGGLISALFP